MTAGAFLHIPNTFTDDKNSSAMFVYTHITSPTCSLIQYSEYTESPTTDVVVIDEPPECSGCNVRIPNKTVFEAASSYDCLIVYSEYESDDSRTESLLECEYSEYGDRSTLNGGYQGPFSVCCNDWYSEYKSDINRTGSQLGHEYHEYSEYDDHRTLDDASVIREDTLDAGKCPQDIYSEYKTHSNEQLELDDPIILNIWISFR